MATHIDTPPNKAWVQVTDDALNCSKDGAVMVRTYKLPTSKCKNILDYVKVGYTPAAVENWLASGGGSLDDGGISASNFTPLSGNSFGLNSYQLQQIEAGEYMLLKCRYEYTGIDIDDLPSDPEETWQKEVSESWAVSWQTYSVSPYIYCDEVMHNDAVISSQGTIPAPTGKHALRRHIELAITQNAQDSNNNPYLWRNNSTFQLTEDEVAIWKKVAAGVNPVFHKPIVTKTSVWKSNKEYQLPQASGNIDQIGLPGGATAQGWTGSFIYCGQSYTQSKQTVTTPDPNDPTDPSKIKSTTIYTLNVVETWEGALEPDLDFYGIDAWKFHEGPSRQQQSPGGNNNG